MTDLRTSWRAILVGSICIVPALLATAQDSTVTPTGPEAPAVAAGQSATQLPDGSWLLLGGQSGSGEASSQAVWMNETLQERHTLAQSMQVPRRNLSAAVVPDGTVLVFGGLDSYAQPVADLERYHPDTQAFENLGDFGVPARAGQSATLLSDGTVLIVGGTDGSGLVHQDATLFDPTSLRTSGTGGGLSEARTGHQARLLPTGDVLIWGGRNQDGELLSSAEIYRAATARFQSIAPAAAGPLVAADYSSVAPAVVASMPIAGAKAVAPNAQLLLRFSRSLELGTLSDKTVTLQGPGGDVAVNVVGAERGLLVFVTPKQNLLPGRHYTLFVKGAATADLRELPFTTISFSTATLPARAQPTLSAAPVGQAAQSQTQSTQSTPKAADPAKTANRTTQSPPATVPPAPPAPPQHEETPAPQTADSVPNDRDGELWLPTPNNLHGVWRSGLERHPAAARNPLKAAPGVTAVSGIVLRLHGQPLSNVTLSIGQQKAVTDAQGKFLLQNVPSGSRTLVIDATTADAGGRHYGRYEYLAPIEAGKTNVLPFIIWMTRLDTANAVNIPSPTTAETVATNPRIPGLELRIPAGTVIRDSQGKNVTQITITAIPVDQPPFPLPNHWVPVYFTIQPGGAHLQGLSAKASVGARLIYPNFSNAPAGERIDFWNYDPAVKGWYIYGQGTVSADRKQIVPDPGVVIYEFTGAMVALQADAAAIGPVPGGCNGPNAAAKRGDPVDCFTGLYTLNRTDLYVADVIPLAVQRSYRPLDTSSRGFGIGANLSYDMFIVGNTNPYTYMNLILPDGSEIYYSRTSSGTSYNNAVYQTQTPGPFFGSTISWVNRNPSYYWVLQLPNGTTLGFPEAEGQTNARCAALTGITDRYGNSLTLARNSSTCNLTGVTSPNGHQLTLAYDSTNRVTQVADDSGRTVKYTYNAAGTLATAQDPAGNTETYSYDSSNRLQTITDKRNNLVLTNVYNSNSQVTQQTYADNSTSSWAYTTNGNGVTTQTNYSDERGNVEQIQFNSAGYPTTITRAFGTSIQQTTTFNRNATTNLAQSATDALGRTTAYQYDAFGNITQVTYLSGTGGAATWNYSYTSTFEELASITDPANHTTSFTYDAYGNLVTATDANGNVASFTYNAAGQMVSATRYVGGTALTTQFGYAGGTLSSVADPLNRKTSIFRDELGRPATIQDPLGNQTHIAYNALDSVTQTTDPLGHATQLRYDANQNLLTSLDPNNVTQTFTYDPRNRAHTYQDPAGKIATYNYDGGNNLTSAVDRKSQTTGVTYDALNRPTLVTYQDGSSVAITWDAGNRPTQFVDSANGTISRTYDLLDRLTQETSPQGQVTYTYDAANRRQTMTVAGQAAVNYTFDNGNRLTQVAQGTNSLSIGYDTANRRTSITLPNGVVGTYTFDNADEVTAIAYASGSTQVGTITYTYDADGRRASVGGTLVSLITPSAVTATYDGTNRLTNYGGTALTYDADGNLSTFGSTTYTWNARNQLTATSGGTATFSYDALGRRVGATANGTTTPYLYDGLNPVTVNGNLLLATGMVDEILAQVGSSSTTSYLKDGVNSTVAVTGSNGAISGSYSYGPYGASSASGTGSTPFQYTGRDNDGTGLYYYRARYYAPQYGRFISEDPLSLGGGTNFYAYAEGDPISEVDPLGLLGMEDIWGAMYTTTSGWTPSQGLINSTAGFGDGAYRAITLGLGNLQDVRDLAGIDGGINQCSTAYRAGRIIGEVDGGIALGGAVAAKSFAPGGWLNSNRYLRIGYGRSGGDEVFRAAGQWVEKVYGDTHFDFWKGGPL